MKKEVKIAFLSHWINSNTPVYGNKGGFKRTQLSSIAKGSSANSEYWEFNNHLGTHIDFPKHFCEGGKTSSDYPASFFLSDKVSVITMPSVPDPGSVINVSDVIELINPLDPGIEVLFLKTGFEKFRSEEIYWFQNIGYSHKLYTCLREAFPNLRFFGFDTISLTSLLHRDEGKLAHKHFLCSENPILIIEDMHLDCISDSIQVLEIFISHSMIDHADGGPVNCIIKHI